LTSEKERDIMARESSKPPQRKQRTSGVSTSEKKKRKTQRKREDDKKDSSNNNNNPDFAAESIKARQAQSSKEIESNTPDTCRQQFKPLTPPCSSQQLDRDKPMSLLQKQRFEEFTRDAVQKGVKGILDEYMTHLKPFVPPEMTRIAFDANPKKIVIAMLCVLIKVVLF
jgi:flagellar biosynthesis GTPase FlhF